MTSQKIEIVEDMIEEDAFIDEDEHYESVPS